MDNLEYKIEFIRRELLKTAEEKGLSSNETVKLSVELDHLLNDYSYDEKSSVAKNSSLDRKIKIKSEKFG
ncbi:MULTISPECIES: aspartyl-phosphate phosphatase Spo0E family protein [unclassified Sporosarcina]|uniref:aspartyl-phosphate phosphatase Spo0E family protein n=1 Tax=unclassified Sporosarcina TaxID=2647733 RepID=UPI00057B5D74|nr:aspartyl-phosphate phosphatase Spo0E family protein [Sporosarcina sp. ZBG7A]